MWDGIQKNTTNSIFPADILISHGSDKKEQQQKNNWKTVTNTYQYTIT